jgi:hypothetical protein
MNLNRDWLIPSKITGVRPEKKNITTVNKLKVKKTEPRDLGVKMTKNPERVVGLDSSKSNFMAM